MGRGAGARTDSRIARDGVGTAKVTLTAMGDVGVHVDTSVTAIEDVRGKGAGHGVVEVVGIGFALAIVSRQALIVAL